MRSLTMAATRLVVLGALLLAGVPRAAAQAPPAGQETGNEESPASPEFGIGVTLGSYTATGTAQGGSEAQPGAPVAVAWTAVGPELIGLRGVSGTLPDGAPCMSLVAQAFPTAETASGTVQNLTALRDLGALGRACPGTPSVSPQMLAVSFWERAGLPVPAPYVAPGWMITGMRAYLEANSSATASFAYPTPFGTLAIDAWTEDLVVNWGDGTGRERYDSLGGPYPDGDVVHIYADKGSVDITVTQMWTATWSLAGQSGTLDGATTSGAIDDFQLRELEAVID